MSMNAVMHATAASALGIQRVCDWMVVITLLRWLGCLLETPGCASPPCDEGAFVGMEWRFGSSDPDATFL